MTASGSDDLVVALDVGGTSIKGAIVDSRYRIVHQLRRRTPRAQGPDAVVAAIGEVLAALVGAAPTAPVAAGVVVPGVVDESRGIAVASANLGWTELPLQRSLQDRAGLPVRLGHDVRAGALAEQRLGAAQGVTDVLFLPIGFGIAAALIVDGNMLVAGGYAGELGHIVVQPDGEVCGCGRRGCLETVASAAAIGRRYSARLGHGHASAAQVAALARTGDTLACAVWGEAVTGLADALELATMLVAPKLVVIGGGLSLAGDLLLDGLRTRLDRRFLMQRSPRIVPAALGDRAGCLGAAILAFQALDGPGIHPYRGIQP